MLICENYLHLLQSFSCVAVPDLSSLPSSCLVWHFYITGTLELQIKYEWRLIVTLFQMLGKAGSGTDGLGWSKNRRSSLWDLWDLHDQGQENNVTLEGVLLPGTNMLLRDHIKHFDTHIDELLWLHKWLGGKVSTILNVNRPRFGWTQKRIT